MTQKPAYIENVRIDLITPPLEGQGEATNV